MVVDMGVLVAMGMQYGVGLENARQHHVGRGLVVGELVSGQVVPHFGRLVVELVVVAVVVVDLGQAAAVHGLGSALVAEGRHLVVVVVVGLHHEAVAHHRRLLLLLGQPSLPPQPFLLYLCLPPRLMALLLVRLRLVDYSFAGSFLFFLLSEIAEVGMPESLLGGDPLVGIVSAHLVYELDAGLGGVRDQLLDARTFLRREIEIYASVAVFHFVQNGSVWGSQDIVNFRNLIHFIGSGK